MIQKMIISMVLICSSISFGCGKRDARQPDTQATAISTTVVADPEKSLTRQTIEGMTGKTTVDLGQRTKAKIAVVDENEQKKNDELDDIMAP